MASTVALAHTHFHRARHGACSLPGPVHLHNGCQVTQSGRSKMRARERGVKKKEEGVDGAHLGAVRCLQHILEAAAPCISASVYLRVSVRRLCSQEREHFLLLFFHLWLSFFEHLLFQQQFVSLHYLVLIYRLHMASTTLPCHSVAAGGSTGLACKKTRQPTFKQETHPEQTGLNTQSQVLSEGVMKEGVFSPKDTFGTKDIPCKVQDYLH